MSNILKVVNVFAAVALVDGGGGVAVSELVVVIAYVQAWPWSSRLGEKLGSN